MTRYTFKSSKQLLCGEQAESRLLSCLVRAEGGLDELLALGIQAAGSWELGDGYLKDTQSLSFSLSLLSLSHAYTGSNGISQGRVVDDYYKIEQIYINAL